MSSLLTILMIVIFLACVATAYADGMWSNAIRLINVVTAALLAMNFFEPAARWLDDWQPSYTYVWDFLALWGLFAVFLAISRELTDRISRVNVRFLKIADKIGSGFFSCWIGWVMVCFTMMTLHTAPLSRTFLFDGFHAADRMLAGFSPARQWLGFTQKQSMGAFCRSATEAEWKQEKFVFDPHGQFMPKYATRRANIQANIAQNDTLRVNR